MSRKSRSVSVFTPTGFHIKAQGSPRRTIGNHRTERDEAGRTLGSPASDNIYPEWGYLDRIVPGDATLSG